MGWFVPVMMAAGAIAGNQSARAANKQRRQEQKMNEIEARYSHWLSPQYRDVSPGASQMGSMFGGAMMGGLQGAQLGKSFGGSTDPTGGMGNMGQNALGSQKMVGELQSDFGSVVPDVQKKIDAGMATPYTGASKYSPGGMTSVDEVTLQPTAPLVIPDSTLDPMVYPDNYSSQIQRSMYMDPRFARQFGAGLIRR